MPIEESASPTRRGPCSRRAVLGTAAAAALAGASPSRAGEAPLRESRSDRDRRMKWWREARFGMFIHWGVYAVPAGVYEGRSVEGIGEWIQASANIPAREYARFPPRFNPVQFDAAEWVRIAKDAGMKYLVITSKHHDGFCLFDSAATDWDIVDASPFGRDVLQRLSRECRRAGIRFCTYYSILDWHHPSQFPNPRARNPHAALASNAIHPERKAEYLAYVRTHMEELLRICDPDVLWFDGEWVEWWTEEDGKALYRWLRRKKPSLIINNRIGKGRQGMEGLSRDDSYAGDFGTPEQQIPPQGLPGVDWESCMTMNDTWGFKANDHNWKSVEQLIRNLCDIASKGGNFLLNVGPTAQGLIPAPSVERLAAVGEWMRRNGEAIYATGPSPFARQLPWGRATTRPGKVYLHVFDWPQNGVLRLPPLEEAPRRAALLADRRRAVEIETGADGVTLRSPGPAPDAPVSVVALEAGRRRAL